MMRAQSGLGQTGEMLRSVCPTYASGFEAVDKKEASDREALFAKYADADGMLYPATQAEALGRYDTLTRDAERMRDLEWKKSGRQCVEDLAASFCAMPADAFTPELKQILELAVRSYNAIAKSGTVRLADAHDIFVRKLNECVLRKRGISEISFRMMEIVASEMRDAMSHNVKDMCWSNVRVISASLLALVVGVVMGYLVARV